ncbi:class I SAM-dependent methyltransferase [Patescibacteria group bacterium]|nr:class I SAM-dependent methyltransferase [Patescibacteria group bacterium]
MKTREEQAKKFYIEAMRKLGKTEDYINSQISFIFSIDGGYNERFQKLINFMKEKSLYSSILISGSSVGTELLLARGFGFKKIYGTEINNILKQVSEIRLTGFKDIRTVLVKDEFLPFPSEKFPVVMSGHIIEHTKDPERYLCELFRVLKKNGLLYLEYPDRYNNIELHTNTKSYEYLPTKVRNLVLTILSSQLNFNCETRKKYKSVRDTLVPISFKDINMWLKKILSILNFYILKPPTKV